VAEMCLEIDDALPPAANSNRPRALKGLMGRLRRKVQAEGCRAATPPFYASTCTAGAPSTISPILAARAPRGV